MENKILDTMFNHVSCRSFLEDKEVSLENIETIFNASRLSANSVNGQQVSVILVKDKSRREFISKEVAKGQFWIAKAPVFAIFVMDFNKVDLACRHKNTEQGVTLTTESLLVGLVDIGINLQSAIVASEALGLGTVAIGGVRDNMKELIKMLNLPKYTLPIVGLCIGHIKNGQTMLRPKQPLDTFMHNESYQSQAFLKERIETYNDVTMKEYYENRGEDRDWCDNIVSYYGKEKIDSNITLGFRKMGDVLLSQGFELKW